MVDFLLGLPALRDGMLWRAAVGLGAPVLVSANALSTWRPNRHGDRSWTGFDHCALGLVHRHPVYLDSAGFTAMARYRCYPWPVADYIALCAAAPWRWCAMMDACCEAEIAHDEQEVLDRISLTVRNAWACLMMAADLGIEHRMLPVLQGRRVEHYLRCLDRMPDLSDFPVIGLGSMCRRPTGGKDGVVRVVEELDRALGTGRIRFHLFGVKTEAAALLRDHPRVASVDSQAYGTGARQRALRGGFAKTDRFVAGEMSAWYRRQLAALAMPAPPRSQHPPLPPPPVPPQQHDPFQQRIAEAADELRALFEAGEVEWSDLSPQRVLEWALM